MQVQNEFLPDPLFRLARHVPPFAVEVHPDPESALSDGDQSLDFGGFAALMRDLRAFAEAAGRSL